MVVNNVTEQKHAQQALEESEARFRAFFEEASVGMAVREVSLKPRFLRVNRKLCEILGYDEGELLQMTSLDVTTEEGTTRQMRTRLGRVIDRAGRMWAQGAFDTSDHALSVTDVPAGRYTVRVIDDAGRVEERQVLIKR